MRTFKTQPVAHSRKRTVTLSDCLGLVATCAIGCALFRSGGPLRPSLYNPPAILLFIGLCALGAGPFVMLPRVLPSGWRTMSSTESAWLIFGLAVDIFLVVVVFHRPAEFGWPALLAAPVLLFGVVDFFKRARLPPRKLPVPTATSTRELSVTVWVVTFFVLLLSLIIAMFLLAFA